MRAQPDRRKLGAGATDLVRPGSAPPWLTDFVVDPLAVLRTFLDKHQQAQSYWSSPWSEALGGSRWCMATSHSPLALPRWPGWATSPMTLVSSAALARLEAPGATTDKEAVPKTPARLR